MTIGRMLQETVTALLAGVAVGVVAWAGMSILGHEFAAVEAVFCGLCGAVGSVLGGLDRPA